MTQEKLTELGFGDVYGFTIARTCQKMHRQIDKNPELAERVREEIRQENAPNPVDADNYNLLLYNWVNENAEALHRDRANALLSPNNVVADSF